MGDLADEQTERVIKYPDGRSRVRRNGELENQDIGLGKADGVYNFFSTNITFMYYFNLLLSFVKDLYLLYL